MEAVLQSYGFAYDYADLYQSPASEPPVSKADALIFLGGSMSANDDLGYIGRELDHIKTAVQRSRPVLGICLGAQLIAKALGASWPVSFSGVGAIASVLLPIQVDALASNCSRANCAAFCAAFFLEYPSACAAQSLPTRTSMVKVLACSGPVSFTIT